MRNLLFFACGVALLVTVSTAFAQNFIHSNQSNQSSFVNKDNSSDMSSFTSNSQTSSNSSNSSGYQHNFTNSQSNSDSSGYQHSSLNLNAVNLRQPHILSINTSGNHLTGEITVNGKVVKRLNHNSEKINISPFLSVGEQTVKVAARYVPASSSVNVELSGPSTNVTQQNSGNGILNYTMDVTVR